MKKKNQELEKFKFVLDYKIKELKKQIEPRENEIKIMKEQIKVGRKLFGLRKLHLVRIGKNQYVRTFQFCRCLFSWFLEVADVNHMQIFVFVFFLCRYRMLLMVILALWFGSQHLGVVLANQNTCGLQKVSSITVVVALLF